MLKSISLIMIKHFLFVSFIVVFTGALDAQWNRVIAYGDTAVDHKCFDGYVDSGGNQIIAFTDIMNNNLGIAKFNANQTFEWSFTTQRDVSGETHVQELSDGNYLIAYNEMYSAGLLKLSPNGSVVWQRSYLGFVIEAIEEDVTQDLYLCGNYYGVGLVSCLNDTGGVRWISKNTQCTNYMDMTFTDDGKLFLVGSRMGLFQGTAMVLSKVNKSGAELWTKSYSHNFSIHAKSVVQSTIDHCFYIAGALLNPSDPIIDSDLMYAKVDSTGQIAGMRTMGYVYGNYGHDLVQAEGNTFILAGSSRPIEICGGTNLVFVKFTSNLDTVFTRRYGDASGMDMTVYQLKKYQPGNYYMFMHAYTYSVFSLSDVIHIRTDSTLDVPCKNLYFPMTGTEHVLTPQSGSNFAIDSATIGFAMNVFPRIMHAADPCTGALLSMEEPKMLAGPLLFPNPALESVRISEFSNRPFDVRIYSISGTLVADYHGLSGDTIIPVWNWAPGIYQCIMTDGDKMLTRKLVIGR